MFQIVFLPSDLDRTLNYLMTSLQSGSFGEYGILLHIQFSQVHSDPEKCYILGSDQWVLYNFLTI